MNKDIVIICKSVWFYSSTDEDMFFEWIKKTPIITKFDGAGDELYLYIASADISDDSLRELIALLYRYKVNMKQLATFLTPENKTWFHDNKHAYWNKHVFGNVRPAAARQE